MSNVKCMVETVSSFFEIGEQVVVGVSGGADSMALLHCLKSSGKNLNIVAAHLNHGLRGQESKRDENFVRGYCLKHNICFVCKYVDVKTLSKKFNISVEECGRNSRYSFFYSVGGRVATAHTLSDLVETFFINIMRGCGLKGLTGIPVKRGRVVRPLLNFTRKDIECYCKINNIDFVNDSTNFEDIYLRNRVRLNVIPALVGISSNFEHKLLNTVNAIKEDEEFLDCVADRSLEKSMLYGGLNLKYIKNLHVSIKVRLLAKFLRMHMLSPTSNMLNQLLNICSLGVGRQSLPKNMFATIRRGILYIEHYSCFKQFKILLPKTIEFFYKKLYFIRCNAKKYTHFLNSVDYLFLFKFDCDKISGDVYIRGRSEKDKIKLLNRPTKTLKCLMQEKRLSKKNRDSTIILADDAGPFWVYGFGADVRVLPNEESLHLCLVFEILK